MPEIRIRYDDDSDRCPHAAVAAVIQAAAEHLPVAEISWVRDDDLDDEPKVTEVRYEMRPDLSRFDRGGLLSTHPVWGKSR